MRAKIDVIVRFYKAYPNYDFIVHKADLGMRYFCDDFKSRLAKKKRFYIDLIPSLARSLLTEGDSRDAI